jgi:Bifunctional DNA primase/polymerase, N-terminal
LQVIAAWWADFPGALPGIDLDKIDAVVLDGDRHHPEIDGRSKLRSLVLQHRIDMGGVPITMTPADGVHCYFSNPAGIGCPRKLPAGIDVKGVGGFTLAPGSVVPPTDKLPSGGIYKPVGKCLLSAVKNGALPPLPERLAAAIIPPKIEPVLPPIRFCTSSTSGRREHAYAKAALAGLASDIAGMAKDTGRNNRLNDAALRIGHMVASGWIDRGEAEYQLQVAAQSCGLIKDSGLGGVRATIRSGLDAGMREPYPSWPP